MIKSFFSVTDEEIKEVKILHNYHSHTYLCNHAEGEVKDYVKRAVEEGFTEIGVSDHFTNPFNSANNFMTFEVLREKYLPQFSEAKALYGDKISILKGVETEYSKGYDGFYRELRSNLDYMVLGQHEFMDGDKVLNSYLEANTERNFLLYLDAVKDGIDSGLFFILAHLDVAFFSGYIPSDRVLYEMKETIKFAKEKNILVEINVGGTRKYANFSYPTDYLLDILKDVKPKVVISADAHRVCDLIDDDSKRLYVVAKKSGLDIY